MAGPPTAPMTTTETCPRRTVLLALAGAAAGLRAEGAFPQRAISLQVPFAPGGIADLTARAVAQAMQATLGQPLVVENRPGAGSIVASQAVAGAAPDGHTLLLMSNGHAVASGLFRKLPYDAARDFAPIIRLASFELALFVPARSRHHSLADLIAEAQAKPGGLAVGSVSIGSTQHLAGKLFEALAGIDLLNVPYKATPALLQALRGGEVDLAFEILGPWLPQVQAGALRVLATTGAQRAPELPEVPTAIGSGLPALRSFEVHSWNALAAPARTPAEVVATLNRAANEALKSPLVRRQFEALAVRPLGGSPEDLRALLAADSQRWGEVIRRARIEPQ